jgi:hypothetical protein
MNDKYSENIIQILKNACAFLNPQQHQELLNDLDSVSQH